MNTIKTYEQDSSALGRINAWTMAFNIAKDRPMGAGFATAAPVIYEKYAPDPSTVLVAHSIYFQVMGEHGFIGLALYLLFWIATFLFAAQLSRKARYYPDLAWCGELAKMIRVSLIGFLVGGAFLSLAYWDVPFYLMVVLVAMGEIVRQHETSTTSSRSSRSSGRTEPPGGTRPVQQAGSAGVQVNATRHRHHRGSA
jgi:putative inorganic carbon (HCO3(-)) transporter